MTASLFAPMELYMIVRDPDLIRRLMETKEPRITGRAMARQIWPGKSHSYMNRILSGDVRSVSVDTATKIAYQLGVPTDVLFVTRTTGNVGQSDEKKVS